MKNKILIRSCIALSLSSNLFAGGVLVVPVVPLIPIETIDPSPFYLGAGLVGARLLSCEDCRYEDVTYGAMIRGGYDYSEYLGIEARYIHTFLDEGPFGGTPLMHAGLFLKPQYPVNERVNVYGLLGYGYTENLGNGGRLNYFDRGWGFSAGAGIEYDLSNRDGDLIENGNYDREFDGYADQGEGWSLFLDFQRLLIESNVPSLDVMSLGLRYDF